MFKKSMVLLTTGALAVSVFLPFGGTSYAKASELENPTPQVIENQEPSFTVIEGGLSVSPVEGDEITIQPMGWKKYFTEAALKAASWSLRHGGEAIDKVASNLTKSEAKIFKEHADTIADTLDYLVSIGDLAEQSVQDKVASALMGVGVKSSVARTIANMVSFFAF